MTKDNEAKAEAIVEDWEEDGMFLDCGRLIPESSGGLIAAIEAALDEKDTETAMLKRIYNQVCDAAKELGEAMKTMDERFTAERQARLDAERLVDEITSVPGVEDCILEHDRDLGTDLHERAVVNVSAAINKAHKGAACRPTKDYDPELPLGGKWSFVRTSMEEE